MTQHILVLSDPGPGLRRSGQSTLPGVFNSGVELLIGPAAGPFAPPAAQTHVSPPSAARAVRVAGRHAVAYSGNAIGIHAISTWFPSRLF